MTNTSAVPAQSKSAGQNQSKPQQQDTNNKKQKALFDFEANQPNRVFDKDLLHLLYKKAVVVLMKRQLSIMAEYLNVTAVQWTLTEEIPTAALCRFVYSTKIIINVNFVLDIICKDKDLNIPEDMKYCSEELASLLAHELMHSLLRHMKDYYSDNLKDPYMRNAAQDMFINWMLVHSFGFSMNFSKNYLEDEVLKYLSPYLISDEYVVRKAKNSEATCKEIYDFLLKEAKDKTGYEEREPKYVFIGSHTNQEGGQGDNENNKGEGEGEGVADSGSGDSDKEGINEKDAEMIREVAKSCSRFGQYFDSSIINVNTRNKTLEDALKKSEIVKSIKSNFARFCKSHSKGDIIFKSKKPTRELTKREKTLLAAGLDLYRFTRTKGNVKTKAVIYFDVSGSVWDLVPIFYGMVEQASKTFDLDIFVFSTELHPITLEELKKGKVKSTGGTCFNTWAKDLAEKPEYKAAVIITDGYGDADQTYLSTIKSNRQMLNVLVVDGGRMPDYIKSHCANIWDLELRK